GEVHVHVDLGVEVFVEAEDLVARADVAHRRLRALLHALLEEARDDLLALARHHGRLALEDRAARHAHAEAVGEADLVAIARAELVVLGRAQVALDVLLAHHDAARQLSALAAFLDHHAPRDLPADGADLAL